ncbi:hypothetical protein EDB89DRAFT_1983538 [Lactarius sanguifluus]|nr:hypothetical protein EDB89DRAFT_1983538 [Lactarius sanguifluus]
MTQLETLSLHFLTLPPRRNLTVSSQSGERIVLPALTCLKYKGTSKYLDSLVARIDAPRLEDLGITFFNQPTMDASQLGRFIERTEIQMLFSRADIQTTAHTISICCSKPEPGTPSHTLAQLGLQILCEQSDWQFSSIAQICNHFSTFLSRVKNLGINLTQPPSEKDGVCGEQWPDLIRAFGGTEDFHVAGAHATDMLSALCTADGGHATDTTMLPALRKLHLEEPTLIPESRPLWDAARPFITSRLLSGRPVQVLQMLPTSFPCRFPGCLALVTSDVVARLGGFCSNSHMQLAIHNGLAIRCPRCQQRVCPEGLKYCSRQCANGPAQGRA